MESTFEKEIDEIRYIMRPANALASWSALKSAMGIFKNISGSEDKIEIGTILQNLGSKEVELIEKLIFEHTSVVINDEKPFKLSSQLDAHFNQHRSHIIQVLFSGVVYQFSDFFPKELISKVTDIGSQLITR